AGAHLRLRPSPRERADSLSGRLFAAGVGSRVSLYGVAGLPRAGDQSQRIASLHAPLGTPGETAAHSDSQSEDRQRKRRYLLRAIRRYGQRQYPEAEWKCRDCSDALAQLLCWLSQRRWIDPSSPVATQRRAATTLRCHVGPVQPYLSPAWRSTSDTESRF